MSENLTRKFPEDSAAEIIQMIQAVRAELSDLRNAVETRLYDTRPIWEEATADVSKLTDGQEELKESVESLIEGIQSLKESQEGLKESYQGLKQGRKNCNKMFARFEHISAIWIVD